MRVLLSTIGSRGETQPIIAVAVEMGKLGHEAVVCAPPDFQGWAESLGVRYIPVGPELHGTAKRPPSGPVMAEQQQQMIDGTVAVQFEAVGKAAEGCDVIVGGGGLAIAAHSIAEHLSVPYVYAAFAPITLPSPFHAPPAFGLLGEQNTDDPAEFAPRWEAERSRWNTMWRRPLNAQRELLGLPQIEDVRSHLFTDRPWLAADPVLAPWPGSSDMEVFQTGAWLLEDPRPLEPELEAFLTSGEPPIYFGLGSAHVPPALARAVLDATRAAGRRAVVSRGWADLDISEGSGDVIAVGDVNQRLLFPRVAAIAHHGGAGTTTVATASGTPQIVIPQNFDQFYFAARVEALGAGVAIREEPTGDVLRTALARVLGDPFPAVATTRGEQIATDGAGVAARTLLDVCAGRWPASSEPAV